MATNYYKTCVLFGGAGFIGTHMAALLLDHGVAERVVIADIVPENRPSWAPALQRITNLDQRVSYAQLDIREPIIDHPELPPQADLIINLAAVHREPGHEPIEYFETNLKGAEHVCDWARQIQCNRIIFTSSIAAYGTSVSGPKTETSLPTPLSPYGISKLVAEKIHTTWLAESVDRKLLIVRPGVIFGPGERGNVTRMVRAMLKNYFVYTGNKYTRKAGGYVKDLCLAILWMMERLEQGTAKSILFNFSMDPAPTIAEYAQAISQVGGVARPRISIPYRLLLAASHVIHGISRIAGINQPINPVRIKKVVRSNYIEPAVLRESGFRYRYSLEDALADWKKDLPQEWTK